MFHIRIRNYCFIYTFYFGTKLIKCSFGIFRLFG